MLMNICAHLHIPDELKSALSAAADCSQSVVKKHIPAAPGDHVPLFSAYPALAHRISYVKLADLPSPIIKASALASEMNGAQIFIKHDGVIGPRKSSGTRMFSGNKIRKLEFLLADALACGARSVITFGAAGSNFALATTIYAHLLGLESFCMLKPQHNAKNVQKNLLLQLAYNAHLFYAQVPALRDWQAAFVCLHEKNKTGYFPYLIPTGGSSIIGIFGFVNGAFELKEQIESGACPLPAIIYVAVGSAGTLAGLLLGLKAARLNIQVKGITVEPIQDRQQFEENLFTLIEESNKVLHGLDRSFPLFNKSEFNYSIDYDHAGSDYGLFSSQGHDAQRLMAKLEGIILDGTYSAKACAALIADMRAGLLHKSTVLYWHTYSSYDGADELNGLDFRLLPHCFHTYFTSDVQPLDR